MKALLVYLLLTLNVTTYKTDDLTYEILVNRTPDNLIIEDCTGIVLDNLGNGQIVTSDPHFNYISYHCISEEITKGDVINTFFVYNPDTKYEDDIIYRIDVLPDGNVYIN